MFFKKRVNVRDYCDVKLQALTSEGNLRAWATLQDDSNDQTFRAVPTQRVVDELLAAHVQLLSLAITKRYRNIDLAMGAGMSVRSFFASRNNPTLEPAKDEYNRAFGSSPSDGVREMVRLFNRRVAGGALSERTTSSVYDLMYRSLASYFSDFKGMKLVFTLGG